MRISKKQNQFTWLVVFLISLFVVSMVLSVVKGEVVPTPTENDYTVIQEHQIINQHGSSTKLQFIKYNKPMRVLAWVHRNDVTGEKTMKVASFSTKKVGKKEIPVIELSTVLHEMVHLTEFQYIPVGSNSEQIEIRAYDYVYMVEQIFALQTKKLIIINLPK